MPRYAIHVAAPRAKQASAPPRPRDANPARGPAWHALQLKVAQTAAATKPQTAQALPAPLQAGLERLSGFAMEDVRVHRNSAEPARLGALAYAQGRDIHLGPGQERQLPHEAWHVVQQKQGRVHATARMKGRGLNDDRRLEREADAMGTRAASLHPAEAGPADRQTLPARASGSAGGAPIQCAGHIRFANLSGEAKYVTKAQSVVDGLRNTPSIQNFLQNKDVLITLESDPMLASVRVVGDQVQISLSPWFFEQESRGRILGMLAHEFGVHPLADQAMTAAERTQEDLDYGRDTAFATGIAGHNITPQAAGQRDHVFAAVANQPRFRIYRQTVHEMATALLATAAGPNPGGVTRAHVTDLIMTYLSDIAMILATNDHRKQIVTNPGRTADAFNLERTRWINSLNAQLASDAALVQLTPGQKTAKNVLGEVTGVGGSWLLSAFTNSTSTINMAHQPLGQGAVAPTNRNQANVLADHGLQLIAGQANARGLLDAIDAAGLQNWRQPALQRLGQIGAPDADDRQVTQIIQNDTDVRAAITRGTLNTLAWTIYRTIRVLEPTGKMSQSPNYGVTVTLVWVKEPAPHYRAAQ